MMQVTLTFDALSTDALRALVPVLLDKGNQQSPNMLRVRRIQVENVLREIEKRTGWAETRLRAQVGVQS